MSTSTTKRPAGGPPGGPGGGPGGGNMMMMGEKPKTSKRRSAGCSAI